MVANGDKISATFFKNFLVTTTGSVSVGDALLRVGVQGLLGESTFAS
jgi:hypothetical protein